MGLEPCSLWHKVEGWLCGRPLIWYWLPPVAWMSLIFGLSAQPALPQAPDELLDTLLKKGAHVIEYAILTVLLWRAWNARQRPVASLALAFVLAVLYAASDEFHQTFVPGRLGRVQDVLIDSLGAALATLGVWAATRGKKRHSHSNNSTISPFGAPRE